MDLKDFFSAAEARTDRWCEMSSVGRAWESAIAQGQPPDKPLAEAEQLLGEIGPLENYWAYPGPRLMATVRESLGEANAGVFARLVQKISNSLLTGGYRQDSGAWDPLQESEARPLDVLPPDGQTGESRKPYFEVLVVTPNDPSTWERARNDLKRLRRPEDIFHYEIVQVGSFEDGVIGTIFNHNVQAVVIYDGFQFRSHHELPMMRDFLVRNANVDPAAIAPGALATTLARLVKNYRPELDIYLLTDRAAEKIAGSEAGAPIRRIFHSVEEIMEVHLSVLDGVNDRYDTPFFSNLKRYAQRPIGTFHALPVARGKSIFRSNWIRDMGQFYGMNLFLAESSATSGGLDSLLEPTGNIKKAQEYAARAFGAKRAYFGTNGT
ncbi:MAG: decarboxylase, partial [Candidatus Binatia bacterium]